MLNSDARFKNEDNSQLLTIEIYRILEIARLLTSEELIMRRGNFPLLRITTTNSEFGTSIGLTFTV
jgi:hypothetical protein